MASVEDQLKNVRTLEDIVNILSILFTNMNTLSRNYYDLFVNPVKMTIPMKLYDDNGNLVTKNIPNIASYKTEVKVYNGDPNGNVEGGVGALCIDLTDPRHLYFKATDSNNDGSSTVDWVRLYDSKDSFLAPNGDGSNLSNISTSQISNGVLPVERGGTGRGVLGTTDNTFSGLVKANGTNPYEKATADIDFVAPASMVGVISYFAGEANIVPSGWLICDGSAKSRAEFKRLYDVIGTRYGTGDGSTTFNLPNLVDSRYIKGSSTSGTTGDAIIGEHNHSIGASSTSSAGSHSHSKGSMRIQGTGIFSSTRITSLLAKGTSLAGTAYDGFYSGAFSMTDKSYSFPDVDNDAQGVNGGLVKFDTNNSGAWTGNTSTTGSHYHSIGSTVTVNYTDSSGKTENDVKHMTMIPIIKY